MPSQIEFNHMRIWLLTNAPSPYQLEFLQELGKQKELDLSIRLMRDRFRGGKPIDSQQHPNIVVMPALGLPGENDEYRFHPRAISEALFQDFDCFILSGLYTSPTFLLTALALFLRGKPIVLWLERPGNRSQPTFWIAKSLSRLRSVTRTTVLRFIFKLSTKVICIGSLAARQYQELGLPSEKIEVVPYCSNTTRFALATTKTEYSNNLSPANSLPFRFLFSGQLIPRKGIDLLLEMFGEVSKRRSDVSLTILGDGPLKNLVEQDAEFARGNIQLLGHVAQEDLPRLFASADAFLFPSRHDGWGVVINEACAAGLPILASTETGAAHDLVELEKNGFRIPCEDKEQWVEKMVWMIDNRSALDNFRRFSLEKSKQCSTTVGAEKMLHVLLALQRE